MKITVSDINIQYDKDMKLQIVLNTKQDVREEVRELQELITKGKELTAEIKVLRKHRSLDSNAYLWVLLSEMANVLHTTKDELYLQALDRYGVFTFVVVKPNVVERVKSEWRTTRELGEVTINGKTGIQMQCFFGSHSYDQKEMCTLLDGVVQECKDMGISTITKSEIELMNSQWGAK